MRDSGIRDSDLGLVKLDSELGSWELRIDNWELGSWEFGDQLNPRPLGRGWTASGGFISRGRPGEGVGTVTTAHPYRKTRSLARTVRQIDNARELRHKLTESEG